MSAGAILKVLNNIPWAQVVENAPKVAEAAEKLWTTVTRRNAHAVENVAAGARPPASDNDVLQRRVAGLEEALKAVQDELRISSQLIKDLAEQNTALVQRIGLTRLHLTRLAIAAGTGFVLLIACCLFLLISR
jgi:hypothetical protein